MLMPTQKRKKRQKNKEEEERHATQGRTAWIYGCMHGWFSTYMYIDIIFLFVRTFHLERMIGVGVNSQYWRTSMTVLL